MRYFFRLFSSLLSFLPPAGISISPTLQSTLCLKAGAKIYNGIYYANLSQSIFNNIFIFSDVFLYLPVI
jgi:hypothetical protein